MDYQIHEVIIDPSGKYRVRVIIDENTTEFFKFENMPSSEEIKEIVENYKRMKQKITEDPTSKS